MHSYTGEYIWIIGASSGIGAALAQDLAARGAVLALSARRADTLDALKDGLSGAGHLSVPLDAGDPAATGKAARAIQEDFPKIDRVIFMAAIYRPHDKRPKDIAFMHDMLRVNIGGAFNMVDSMLSCFEAQGFGQFVICASVAGYRGLPYGQPYCATKAALINYAESLRVEMAVKNIDVKLINPGFVQTPLTDKNDFKMPMIIPVAHASQAIMAALPSSCFEIHFPKKFTLLMKILRSLPTPVYLWLARFIKP